MRRTVILSYFIVYGVNRGDNEKVILHLTLRKLRNRNKILSKS